MQQQLQEWKRQRRSEVSTRAQEEIASAARKPLEPPPFRLDGLRYIVVNLTDAPYDLRLAEENVLRFSPLGADARQGAAEAIQALPQDKQLFVIGADVFGSETKVVQPLATLVFCHLLEIMIPQVKRYKCVDTHTGGKCYLWKTEAPDGVVFTLDVRISGAATRRHLNSNNVAVVFEWKGSDTLDDKTSLPQLIKYLFSFLKESPQRRFVYGLLSDLHHGILVKAYREETDSGEERLCYQIFQRVSGPDLVGLIHALLSASAEDLNATPLTMRKPQSHETMRICLGATLGHGASGDVCVGIQVPDGAVFAIKGLGTSSAGSAHVAAELGVLRALRESDLLRGKWVNLEAEEWLLNERPVMKLPLFEPSRPSLWRRDHIGGVIDALRTIHAAGYIHRDIRPSNFAFKRIDDRRIPLIIDFGCAIPDDCVHRHYSGSKAYASFRFLDDDGSLNEKASFQFDANDDMLSLVLTMFSIFMTADGCIENQPLFCRAKPGEVRASYRNFWTTRLPPSWLEFVTGLETRVGVSGDGVYERVQSFLKDNLPQLPLFAHDLNDADA